MFFFNEIIKYNANKTQRISWKITTHKLAVWNIDWVFSINFLGLINIKFL